MFKFKPQVSRILTPEQIQDLRELEAPWLTSHLSKGSCEYGYLDRLQNGNHDEYTADYRGEKIRHSMNKVITTDMVDDINFEFECAWADAGLKVIDTNYLRYVEGDYLRRHIDTYDEHEVHGTMAHTVRKITAITMIDKSDDLVGGTLIAFNEGIPYSFDLEIGETCFFPSTNVHECTLIERGYREVLVSWMA